MRQGFNIQKVDRLEDLNKEDLCSVIDKVLDHLNLEVYTDSTPDYTEIILKKKNST